MHSSHKDGTHRCSWIHVRLRSMCHFGSTLKMWNMCGILNRLTKMYKETVPNDSHGVGDTDLTVASIGMRFSLMYPTLTNTCVGRMFIDDAWSISVHQTSLLWCSTLTNKANCGWALGGTNRHGRKWQSPLGMVRCHQHVAITGWCKRITFYSHKFKWAKDVPSTLHWWYNLLLHSSS